MSAPVGVARSIVGRSEQPRQRNARVLRPEGEAESADLVAASRRGNAVGTCDYNVRLGAGEKGTGRRSR